MQQCTDRVGSFFSPFFSQEDWEGDHHRFWSLWVGSSSPVAEFWNGCHSSGSQGMNFCAMSPLYGNLIALNPGIRLDIPAVCPQVVCCWRQSGCAAEF